MNLYLLENKNLGRKAVVAANNDVQAKSMFTAFSKDSKGNWVVRTRKETSSWIQNASCVMIGETHLMPRVLIEGDL